MSSNPKRDVEFPIAITVRLDKKTHDTLVRISKEDHRQPAVVARLLIQTVLGVLPDHAFHAILVKIQKLGR